MKTFSGRPASQHPQELADFIDFLHAENVCRYLEVGARHGDTFHEVMLSLPVGSRGVAVDLPGAIWGKEDSRHSLTAVAEDLRKRGYKIEIIFGDSQVAETRDIAVGFGPFDAVLIDADHRYEGVKQDYSLYGSLAPLVAFHDIVGVDIKDRKTGAPVEVPRLWAELIADGADHREFVAPDSLMGIGVLCK